MRLFLALLAAPLVAAFAPATAPVLRPATARMAISARAPSVRPARVSFAMSSDSTSIDFGKVGFAEAESQFSSMVFKPEVGSEPESRCRVDWHTECEKALNDHINGSKKSATPPANLAPEPYSLDRERPEVRILHALCISARRPVPRAQCQNTRGGQGHTQPPAEKEAMGGVPGWGAGNTIPLTRTTRIAKLSRLRETMRRSCVHRQGPSV